ncbi:radical SAM protein [Phycisphaera mikurensis]|uniref:Radical SAM core domain-containing protein n=1 Tax=Phycisphaera mikurensis (strain NBRC 102666 / KCTC 22515 / FYK2301M01) TaxID=1142394 RepID=I0IEF6_PHYMF|nr:radical SAM protein [Phycisphaera mikurensis]MBB6441443.1 cyclic dehypoxanthinyl futalosine synthase [Phycisphaera mikurensis]BAM03644.1 hypothetical protein PSMK_14850 [Phycisphaera mikurensis NBRC 102666]
MAAPTFSSLLHRDLGLTAVADGRKRLRPEEGLALLKEAPLPALGRLASAAAERIHGDRLRTYVIDRNINYTNVCTAACTFCAFKRNLNDADAYVLGEAAIHAKVQELVDIGGNQVLLQGGMHPDLPLGFYTGMLSGLKKAFPQVHLHAFSPPEFVEFVAVLEVDGFPTARPGRGETLGRGAWLAKLEAVMRELMAAGLDSLPGGGGEIFGPHVRHRIGPGKASGAQWLDVMETAHRVGMRTSATMMFGHLEGRMDRIQHMDAVRSRQDRAIEADLPGRYLSFISWPYQRENTPLDRLPDHDPLAEKRGGEPFPGDVLAEAVARGEVDPEDRAACRRVAPGAGKVLRTAGGTEYLRTQAVSRLYLDNIHSIGSSWVTMGPRIGQLGLLYGANDMGSVMMEENVVSAAGTTYCLNEATLCRLVRDAGFVPAQRNNRYEVLQEHPDTPDAPDRRIDDWSTQRPRAQRAAFEPGVKAEAKDGPATVPLTVTAGHVQAAPALA